MLSIEQVEIKGEMLLVSVLQLASTDLEVVRRGLQQKRDSFPQLFASSPLVVDCTPLGDVCQDLDMTLLRELILELGLIPVGIRGLADAYAGQASGAGWAILRAGRGNNAPARTERPAAEPGGGVAVPAGSSVKVIDRPLRSGQQVYFPEGNVVVLQHTSAGSEILAGGSVHVYGSLRGRVLAGVQGDTSARIFCQKLEAELVAIAGCYRLLDDIETDLKGSPAMVWLEDEKLKIAPMF
ncbi:septum site-determining protein MinC [Thiothrix nivea]|uniref:Probable septum site-determining protein MinC n=1 Tax=Thiothrix nivea (strain ATCC 35100 / DSM 5205 / JP2) TaxID=870187 RepID=A0A656H9Q2_THINJ|nr:septum site-determining protein MinC [Thiothrix nivea]EIJ33651.1 septum site-determining protein MinC [Thiothrix nivea DSM 5205]